MAEKWLEKLARDVEAKGYQRDALIPPHQMYPLPSEEACGNCRFFLKNNDSRQPGFCRIFREDTWPTYKWQSDEGCPFFNLKEEHIVAVNIVERLETLKGKRKAWETKQEGKDFFTKRY